MTTKWTYTHPALQVGAIQTADGSAVVAGAATDSQWAAEIAQNVRLYFAQQCKRFPGRVSKVQFTATTDSASGLTITLVAS